MKKTLTILAFLVIMMTFLTVSYAAFTCKIALVLDKQEVSKNEEFTMNINLADIQSERGIITLGATLSYDKDSLSLVKMEGKNGWSNPSYNEDNGKFVLDRSSFALTNETMIQVTFKVKEQAKKNVNITMKNIAISDGNQEATIADSVVAIAVKDGSSNNDNNNNNDNNGNNGNDNMINNNTIANNTITNTITDQNTTNTNKVNTVNKTTNISNNTAAGTLPKTGVMDYVLTIGIIGLVIIAIIFYFRKKVMDQK